MGNVIDKLVFQKPPVSYSDDGSFLWLNTRLNERICCKFITSPGAKFTILFSHGNAEDLGVMLHFFETVSELWNVNILVYDYTGYGLSSGTCSENHVYADVEAAYIYLTKSLGIPWNRIIAFGRSLGSGPTLYISSKYPVVGLIIQSGILSTNRVVMNTRFFTFKDMFPNAERIKSIQCPVLIVHGTRDEIVPVHHGKGLYALAPNAVTPLWVEGAGHNNLEVIAKNRYFEYISRFLKLLDLLTPLDYISEPEVSGRYYKEIVNNKRYLQSPTCSSTRSNRGSRLSEFMKTFNTCCGGVEASNVEYTFGEYPRSSQMNSRVAEDVPIDMDLLGIPTSRYYQEAVDLSTADTSAPEHLETNSRSKHRKKNLK